VAIDIDKPKLKALMRLKPTLEDTASFFECSARSIERFIRDEYDLKFVEFREQNMVHTRLAIVRKAIEKAEKGDNVMLIFCLKNLCGWKDKWDNTDDDKKVASAPVLTKEQFDEYVDRMIQARKVK
jgi:uncharacterized protein YbcV (DUF1398 family)